MNAYLVTYNAQKQHSMGIAFTSGAAIVVANNLQEAKGIAQDETRIHYLPAEGYFSHMSDACLITVTENLLEAMTNNYHQWKGKQSCEPQS